MKITLLPGDGIGVEIVDAAVEVLDAAAKKYNFTVEYDKKLIGGAAIDAFGTPLPEETLASAKASETKNVSPPDKLKEVRSSPASSKSRTARSSFCEPAGIS